MQAVNCKIEKNMRMTSSLCNICDEVRDTFYSNSKKNVAIHVCLNASGLLLQQTTSSGITNDLQVKMSDIVGGRCVRLQKSFRRNAKGSCGVCTPGILDKYSTSDKNEDAFLYVFAYILKKKRGELLRRERTVITLRFRSFDSEEDNMREAEKWYKALQTYRKVYIESTIIAKVNLLSRRLLILLNPKSGSGKARTLFHEHVIPVLNEAELPYDVFVTKHSQYAIDLIRRRDLSTWSSIVAIGGDGLFHEILNGLLHRIDSKDLIKTISLGIVPCGTGNGLARSIAHSYNEPYDRKPVLGAALTLVHGHSTPMDIVEVDINNKIVYSFLSLGWGLISDIDIESERLRPLGYQRFTIWTLHRIISLRTYKGKISYLPKNFTTASSNLKEGSNEKKSLRHSLSCNALSDGNTKENFNDVARSDFEDVISLETLANPSFRSRCSSWLSAGSRKSTYYSIDESLYQSISDNSECCGELEKIYDEYADKNKFSTSNTISDTWVVESGEYVMIHAAYQTHLGSDCHFSPRSKLNDDTIYLVIIRGGISRTQLLNFLINMSSGTHIPTENTEFIQVVQVEAFRLEPHGNSGTITIDGEQVECGPLQAKIIPAAVNIMIPSRDVFNIY